MILKFLTPNDPAPVFLLLNNREAGETDSTRQNKAEFWPVAEVIKRGYGIAAVRNDDVAADNNINKKLIYEHAQ